MEPKPKEPRLTESQDKIIIGLAAIGALAVLYFMFVWIDAPVSKDSPAVAQISTTAGIRRRHSHNLSWGSLKGDGQIYLRDVIYIPKGVKASVTLPSKKVVQIPEDTMIQFDELTLENMEVLLDNFRLMPLKSPTSKMNALLEDIKPYETRLTEISARMYEVVFRTVKLDSIEKSAKPEIPPRLSDYELHLVSPIKEKYNLSANRWMRMSWTPIPIKGVKFKLEMSKQQNFQNGLPYSSEKNVLLTQFDEEGNYHWKVEATYQGESLHSEVWDFGMVLTGGKTPRRVALRKPTNAPSGIRVEISGDANFSQISYSSVGRVEKCPTDKLSSGIYYCRVLSNSTNKMIRTYKFEVN